MHEYFFSSQTGAVTVDWVVLTAGLVGLGFAAVALVSSGAQNTSGDVGEQLKSQTLMTSFQVTQDFGGFSPGSGTEWFSWGWRTSKSTVNGWLRENGNQTYGGYAGDGHSLNLMVGSGGYAANGQFSRNLEDMRDGETYTLDFELSESEDNNGIQIYYGGELVQQWSGNEIPSNYTTMSVDVVAGSGDGSDQLEMRQIGSNSTMNGVNVRNVSVTGAM